MASSRYPTGGDLRDYFISAGLVLANPNGDEAEEDWEAYVDWNAKQQAANASVESATGRRFLAQTATRSFACPGPSSILDLQGDLVSVDTLTIAGRTLTQGTDYWLGPDGNDLLGRPFFQIVFASTVPIWLPGRPITIAGLWGYGAQITEDAWELMIAQAAMLCKPALALAISQGLMVWAKGDKREEYSHYADQGPLSTEYKNWKDTVTAGIASFLKVTF